MNGVRYIKVYAIIFSSSPVTVHIAYLVKSDQKYNQPNLSILVIATL